MSFKIKKWAPYRTFTLGTVLPGAVGAASNSRCGYAFPWGGGKILLLVYAQSTEATIWAVYDPVEDEVVAGPHTVTGLYAGGWSRHSDLFGMDRFYKVWGDKYLISYPGTTGYYHGSTLSFYGWDADFTMYRPSPLIGGRDVGYTANSVGWDGEPTTLNYCWKGGNPGTLKALIQCPLTGSPFVVYEDSGDTLYLTTTWGSTHHGYRKHGAYYSWAIHDEGDQLTTALYPSPPTVDSYLDYLMKGSFGSPGEYNDWGPTYQSHPGGDGTWMNVQPSGEVAYWADATAPLSPIELPCHSVWEYRGKYGLTLDEYDIDGLAHGLKDAPVGAGHVSFNPSLGWFVGLRSHLNPNVVTVYVLDPVQPAGRPRAATTRFSSPAGWAGDYAIRDDLVVEHVLPFPDERNPSLYSRAPVVRKSGYILGPRELFRQRGSKITYLRDILVDLSSYPTSDPDWWWPGSGGDHYDGFWELFGGGGPMIVGRMPDPDFGLLNPLGYDVMYGLGETIEVLPGTAYTHQISESRRLDNTMFATPLAGTLTNRRRELRGCLTDDRLIYTESGTRFQAMPLWRAVAGRVAGGAWQEIADLADVGPPNLGESNWTPWSLCPIPKCRALPLGGWLVGATLYFDPWVQNEWEWEPGGRASTFRDYGIGYVPAVPGYIGPLPIENHAPVYVTTYDEWTANRAYYGPDALLVYDENFDFVECLNDYTVYPPNGKEILVIPGSLPRVLFRVSRHGVYSDCAEGWGHYHGGNAEDVQAPLYVCMDLETPQGTILPGGGTFRGFVDCHRVGDVDPKDAAWRWSQCAPGIYDNLYPKSQWSPSGPVYVREGFGGRGITILSPGPGQGRSGIKGVGRRA